MKKIYLFLIWPFILTACNASETSESMELIDYSSLNLKIINIDNSKHVRAKSAVNTFLQSCPVLGEVKDNIIEATIYPDPSNNEGRWKNPLMLEVVFSQSPTDARLVEWRAFGHHCYYSIGGGKNAGWSTSKSGCASVCGALQNNDGLAEVFDDRFKYLEL